MKKLHIKKYLCKIIELQTSEKLYSAYYYNIYTLPCNLYFTHVTYDYCQTLTLLKTIHFVLMTNH